MVRLQPVSILSHLSHLSQSQFHYGSITTKETSKVIEDMVLVSIPLWFDYNGGKGNEREPAVFGLNSTMVRLQQKTSKWSFYNTYKSQFHYGSITTLEIPITDQDIVKSQFHYGSITTKENIDDNHFEVEVSIPLWFDYNSFERNCNGHLSDVSIPLWFDYNLSLTTNLK